MRGFLLCILCTLPYAVLSQIGPEILTPLQSAENQWIVNTMEEKSPRVFEGNCSKMLIKQKGPWLGLGAIDPSFELNDLIIPHCRSILQVNSLCDLYFPLFEKQLQSAGMDTDYMYLAAGLSGMNPHFEGENDEAGMWQMSYANARRFGLRVDDQIDERRSADVCTKAVIAQLKFLEAKYPESKLKVALAFIRSPMYVQGLEQNAKRSNLPFIQFLSTADLHWITYLSYLKSIHESLAGSSALLDYIDILNEYGSVGFEKDVSFDALCSYAPLDEKQLKQVNPTYIGEKIPGAYRGVTFIVPLEWSAKVMNESDSLYALTDSLRVKANAKRTAETEKLIKNIPTPGSHNEQVYTVRSGDYLGKIASRFGVRVSDIKNWNDLRSDRIDVGQKLVIYKKKGTVPPGPDPKTEPKPYQKTTTSPVAQPAGDYTNYTVQPGESLWLIAKKFPGVSADNIMQWNSIDESIQPGQVLKIYSGK